MKLSAVKVKFEKSVPAGMIDSWVNNTRQMKWKNQTAEMEELDSENEETRPKNSSSSKERENFDWALLSGKVQGKWDIRYKSEKYYVMRVKSTTEYIHARRKQVQWNIQYAEK